MLSEKKKTDRIPTAKMPQGRKKQIRSEQRRWNRRILLYCILCVGHVEWIFW